VLKGFGQSLEQRRGAGGTKASYPPDSDFSTFVKMPKKLGNYRYGPHNMAGF
jgi:hypothetical protein